MKNFIIALINSLTPVCIGMIFGKLAIHFDNWWVTLIGLAYVIAIPKIQYSSSDEPNIRIVDPEDLPPEVKEELLKSITESLDDLNSDNDKPKTMYVPKKFGLQQALDIAREGYFVSSEYFDPNESLHYYNDKYYYEDGAVVTEEFLSRQEFAVKGDWFVVIDKSEVDFDKLDEMHKKANGSSLVPPESYMNCRK